MADKEGRKRARELVYDYVVIGGGIAGVSCAKELARLRPEQSVAIVSPADVLKEIDNVAQVTHMSETFDVYERRADLFQLDNPDIQLVRGSVQQVNARERLLLLDDGSSVGFGMCCVCSGARPNVLFRHPLVIGIRDTQSVDELAAQLRGASSVCIVGNGGIALELVHTLRNFCNITWILRSSYIGNSFFDASASAFVLPMLVDGSRITQGSQGDIADTYFRVRDARTVHGPEGSCATPSTSASTGGALGPEWVHKSQLLQQLSSSTSPPHTCQLQLRFESWVVGVRARGDDVWTIAEGQQAPPTTGEGAALSVLGNDGQVIGCDFMVSATGVVPVAEFLAEQCTKSSDGAIVVDEHMRTSLPNVFAAGDCVEIAWPESPYWFQMRLWSQARTMGLYAARCMTSSVDDLDYGFGFEIFTHITRFFGHKVVLLGKFNAQGLGPEVEREVREIVVTENGLVSRGQRTSVSQATHDPQRVLYEVDEETPSAVSADRTSSERPRLEILSRVTYGHEYVKVVVFDNRVVGAMLVGDTDLEETFENLILNQIDVRDMKEKLLSPDLDLEGFFD